MTPRVRRVVWAVLVIVGIAAGYWRSAGPGSGLPGNPPPSPRADSAIEAKVASATDGDTVVLAGGKRLRLTGIDSPEIHHPRKPVECFGPEAARFMAELLPAGTAVRVATDVQSHDRYGRLLGYVFRKSDGLFVNLEAVRRGYAVVLTVPPNIAHATDFVAAEREAREAGRGLWGGCR